jgi:hypothetical protein
MVEKIILNDHVGMGVITPFRCHPFFGLNPVNITTVNDPRFAMRCCLTLGVLDERLKRHLD